MHKKKTHRETESYDLSIYGTQGQFVLQQARLDKLNKGLEKWLRG